MDEVDKETKIMDQYIETIVGIGMVVLLIYGLLTGWDDGTSPQ